MVYRPFEVRKYFRVIRKGLFKEVVIKQKSELRKRGEKNQRSGSGRLWWGNKLGIFEEEKEGPEMQATKRGRRSLGPNHGLPLSMIIKPVFDCRYNRKSLKMFKESSVMIYLTLSQHLSGRAVIRVEMWGHRQVSREGVTVGTEWWPESYTGISCSCMAHSWKKK